MGRLLYGGAPVHYCNTPGWRHRRQLGIQHGAIWQCDCGRKWEWNSDFEFGGWSPYYPKPKGSTEPIFKPDGTPNSPPPPPAI